MKKLVCLVLVVALVTLCGCSKPNNNEVISSSNDSSVVKSSKVSSTDYSLNEIDFENISDKELEWLYYYVKDYPTDFYFSQLKDYQYLLPSTESVEEAKNAAKEKISDDDIITDCDLVAETEYFYTVNIRYGSKNNPEGYAYVSKYVSFKKDFLNCGAIIPSIKGAIINTKDIQLLQKTLNSLFYIKYSMSAGTIALRSEIIEKADTFEYVIYYKGVVAGDWGVQDTILLSKMQISVSKTNGKILNIKEKELKQLSVGDNNELIMY